MAALTSRTATRVDRPGGYREAVSFVETGLGDLYVCAHLPEGAARQAVVLCPPLDAEFMSNYRREVLFARALAERGHAVARFHYRGSGNSGGDPAALSFESMAQDCRVAVEALVQASGASRVALLGTRMGAPVAASVAADHPGAPFIAWEPIGARRFLREAIRARQMSSITKGSDAKSAEAADDTAARVDILGYEVPMSWPPEFDVDLAEHLGASPRPVHLVQFGAASELRAEYARLVDSLRGQGCDVTSSHSPGGDAWWLHSERIGPLPDLVDLGLDWLDSVAGERS